MSLGGLLLRGRRLLRRLGWLLQELFEGAEDGAVLVVRDLEFPALEARRQLLRLGGRLRGSGAPAVTFGETGISEESDKVSRDNKPSHESM